jgi:hypothetical protein
MDADHPIPADAISLSEAFIRFWSVFSPKPRDEGGADEDDEFRQAVRDDRKAEPEVRNAECEFRRHLGNGRPTAFVRDPLTGERLALRALEKWSGENHIPGFVDDYVGPFPNGVGNEIEPGPSTIVNGKRQPVFLDRAEFETWLK